MPFRRLRTFRTLAVAGALAAAAAGACSSGEPTAVARDAAVARLASIPSGDQAADRAALDEVMRRMRSLATTTGCANGSCEVIGLGRKPCGGPWEFVAYCPTTTDVVQLRAAAAEVDRAERAFNERYGMMASDCGVAPYPSHSCVAAPAASRAP
jgi:hypothetical protein